MGRDLAENKTVEKYLARYSEPETARWSASASKWADKAFEAVLVIPSCGEGERLVTTLQSVDLAASAVRALVIVVLNGREEHGKHVHAANRESTRALSLWCSGPKAEFSDLSGSLFQSPSARQSVLLIDRSLTGRPMAPGQGVGHVRKLGADLALAFMFQGIARGRFIHCTDADARVPIDYFPRAKQAADAAALVYPFEHGKAHADADARVVEATELYEISLRYYVLGLAYARSPYAFHTIGSTLAIDAVAYAGVRGFPRREAGEDFYLLNKLRKTGPIRTLTGAPIRLASRESDRVPFGTGAAVSKWLVQDSPADTYPLYHPRSFSLLRAWIGAIRILAEDGNATVADACTRAARDSDGLAEVPLLIEGLADQGTAEAVARARSSSQKAPKVLDHLQTWFDAFRTRRLMHYLRDHGLPKLSYRLALRQASFLAMPIDTPLFSYCERLRERERHALSDG